MISNDPDEELPGLRQAAIDKVADRVRAVASGASNDTELLDKASMDAAELSDSTKATPEEQLALYLRILEDQS